MSQAREIPPEDALAPVVLADEQIPLSRIVTYSSPALGVGCMFFLVNLYLMKFSTDVLFIAPAAMGTIFGISRIWDAISDPLAGYFSDRTRARLGRRRPWMLASALPIALIFMWMWSPPPGLSHTMVVAWMAVGVLGFYSAMTIFVVPHAAFGAELSTGYDDRNRIFGWRHVAFNGGAFIALAAMQLLILSETPRSDALLVALAVAIPTMATIVWSALKLRERTEYQGRGPSHPYAAFADVLKNPHARLLLIVLLIENVGGATISVLTPYIAQYIVGTPELTVFYIALYMIPSTVTVPMWIPLARRFGKKRLWLFSMALTAIAFGGMFFLHEGSSVLISVLAVLAGTAGGCGAVVGPSIQADVIDYDEYTTGQRKEGAYFAAWNFVFKSSTGVTLILTGWVLQLSGFVPNVEQTEGAKLALRSLYALFPLACYGIGALLFIRFSLNREEHGRIRVALDARRDGTG